VVDRELAKDQPLCFQHDQKRSPAGRAGVSRTRRDQP
jgi:hypothetical protein